MRICHSDRTGNFGSVLPDLYCKRFPILHLERKDFEICWDSFGRLLKLGIPMGLQFSITAIGTIIVQGAVNIYGPVHMAGFSAAGKIQNILPQYLQPSVQP